MTIIVGLLLMRSDELIHPSRRPRSMGDLRAGLACVRSTPELLGPLVLLACVGVVALNFQVLIPLLGYDAFDGDARTVGYLLAAFGAGSVIGGLGFAGVLSASVGRIIAAAVVVGVLFIATGMTPTVTLALGAVFVLGAGAVVYKALTSTWLQLTADPVMRGRVPSLLVVAMGGTTPSVPRRRVAGRAFRDTGDVRHRGRVPVLAAAATYLYARRFISGRGRDQGATAVQTAAAPHEMVAPRGA